MLHLETHTESRRLERVQGSEVHAVHFSLPACQGSQESTEATANELRCNPALSERLVHQSCQLFILAGGQTQSLVAPGSIASVWHHEACL